MKLHSMLVLLSIVSFTVGAMAFAQDEKKDKAAVNKANSKMGQAEKNFDYGKKMYDTAVSGNKMLPATLERVEREMTEASGQLDEVTTILSPVTPSLTEVKDLNTRATALRTKIKEQREANKKAYYKLYDNDLTTSETLITEAIKSFATALSGGTLDPSIISQTERSLVAAEKKIDATETSIKTLDASVAEVKAMSARVASLRAKIKEQREKSKSEGAKIEAADKLLTDGADADGETVDELRHQLDSMSRVFTSEYRSEKLDTWTQVVKDSEAMFAKYESIKATSGSANRMANTISSLRESYNDAIAARDEAVKKIPEMITELLTKSQTAAKDAVTKNSFYQFFDTVDPSISKTKLLLANYAAISAGVSGADTKLGEKSNAAIKELQDARAKHEIKLIETNKAPDDLYKGKDKETMVSTIKGVVQDINKGKILAIPFADSVWTRVVEDKWDASQLAWYKVDESHINAFVIVQSEDGKYAYIYEVTLVKKHLAGDKLIVAYFGLTGKPTTPMKIMLAANVK